MNDKKVIKRDERIQLYDWTKVEAAVSAAFKSVNQEMDDTFKNYLKNDKAKKKDNKNETKKK